MDWGFGWGMGLLMLLAVVVLWTVVALAVRALLAPPASHKGSLFRDAMNDVERRYVAGEIDRDELLRSRRELRGHQA